MNKTFEKNETLFAIDENLVYFLNNIGEFLPYVILNILGAGCGILGNLLIIGSIVVTKELHNMTSLIIANLSLADLVISSITDTFAVAGGCFTTILVFEYKALIYAYMY